MSQNTVSNGKRKKPAMCEVVKFSFFHLGDRWPTRIHFTFSLSNFQKSGIYSSLSSDELPFLAPIQIVSFFFRKKFLKSLFVDFNYIFVKASNYFSSDQICFCKCLKKSLSIIAGQAISAGQEIRESGCYPFGTRADEPLESAQLKIQKRKR